MDDALKDFLLFLICIFFCISLLMSIIALPIVGTEYYGACEQARIYNSLNKKHYTCWDFFWASNQINGTSQTIWLK